MRPLLTRAKILVLLVSVALMLTACVGGGSRNRERDNKQQTFYKPFSDRYFGIMYPSDFETEYIPVNDEGLAIFIANTRDPEDVFLIYVIRGPLGQPLTSEDFRTLIDYAREKIMEEPLNTLLSESNRVVHGQPAYEFRYQTRVYGQENVRQVQIITSKDTHFFILYFATRESKFVQRERIFNEIVDSFEFLY